MNAAVQLHQTGRSGLPQQFGRPMSIVRDKFAVDAAWADMIGG
jgi:hypothetical protein